MLKKLMLVLVALTIGSPMMLLSGCNTVQGAGRDVSKAGDKIQEVAVEHKRY